MHHEKKKRKGEGKKEREKGKWEKTRPPVGGVLYNYGTVSPSE